MNLFTVDLDKEHSRTKNLATNRLSNERYFIENNFQIYYKPKYSSKLINETDVFMNLDYLPKFDQNSVIDKKSQACNKVNINGGYLRVISNINTCQIILSKNQLEQFIKTLDNIVYDENKYSLRSVSMVNLTDETNLAEESSPSSSGKTSPNFASSSFRALYSKFSEKNDESSTTDLKINVKFKIEKLTINFQADVEQPCQDVAELCFNEYALSILKHEKHVKFFDMTLKSLTLIDKLKAPQTTTENDDNFKYLLKSSVVHQKSSSLPHTCNSGRSKQKNSEYLSRSAPNINFIGLKKKQRFRYDTYSHKKNSVTHFLMSDYDQTVTDLSTSLPAEQPRVSYRSQRRISRVSENIDSECPTPPPSPKKTSAVNPLFSEASSSTTSDEEGTLNSNKKMSKSGHQCLACKVQASPMVSIKLIFIDTNHPKINVKFNGFNRFYKIKFADLQLNVNPETWIILLDMLGKFVFFFN